MKFVDKLADAVLVQPGKVAKAAPLSYYPLDPGRVKETAGVQRLAELGPRTTRILEAQTLLDDAALWSMLRFALQQQEVLWFVSPQNSSDLAALEKRFGKTIHCLSCGETKADSSNGRLELFGLSPEELFEWMLEAEPDSRNAFQNIDSGRVTPRVAKQLKQYKIPSQKDSRFRRLTRHPLFSVYIVVFIYSALRALPVSFVKEFHGSLLLFWTIDLVTAVPYTWGALTMLFGKTWQLRLAGAITTIVTFVSPYVYFWLNGTNYPSFVPIVIAVLTLITISTELVKYLQERNLEKHYRRSLGLN